LLQQLRRHERGHHGADAQTLTASAENPRDKI
jgi:hypothetical protein